MVIYDLECPLGHRFEGWFPSCQAFEDQHRHNLVVCAVCGVNAVRRLATGGHLVASRGEKVVITPATETPKPVEQTPTELPVDPVTFLKTLHHVVKKHCVDVGSKFAERAIAMQRGEVPVEPIAGSATVADIKKMDN
ncbi:MAG: DUF1178 family protein, partial [Deltaproteobacteria bacterium]|nr:DUF1178 family protein [Deltaproteobacteria bacterium]